MLYTDPGDYSSILYYSRNPLFFRISDVTIRHTIRCKPNNLGPARTLRNMQIAGSLHPRLPYNHFVFPSWRQLDIINILNGDIQNITNFCIYFF